MSQSIDRLPLEDPEVAAHFDGLLDEVGPYGAITEDRFDDLLKEAKQSVGQSLFATALKGVEDRHFLGSSRRKKVNCATEARGLILEVNQLQAGEIDEAVFMGNGSIGYLGDPNDIFSIPGHMNHGLFGTKKGKVQTPYSETFDDKAMMLSYRMHPESVDIYGYGHTGDIDIREGRGVTNLNIYEDRGNRPRPGRMQLVLGRTTIHSLIPGYGYSKGLVVGRKAILDLYGKQLEDEIDYKLGYGPDRSHAYNMYRLAALDEELSSEMIERAESIGLFAIWRDDIVRRFGMSVARLALRVLEDDLDPEDVSINLPIPNDMMSVAATDAAVQASIRSSFVMIGLTPDSKLADDILTHHFNPEWYDKYRDPVRRAENPILGR